MEGNPTETDPAKTRPGINTAFSRLYEEICVLAEQKLNRQPHQSISPTDLVHETYLRLSKETGTETEKWQDRRFFFSVAAEAMRRILVERTRAKKRLKRGGDLNRTEMTISRISVKDESLDMEALDGALDSLEKEHPDEAELVKLKFFAGLQWTEIAELRNESTRTVRRKWSFARAWLRDLLDTDLGLPPLENA